MMVMARANTQVLLRPCLTLPPGQANLPTPNYQTLPMTVRARSYRAFTPEAQAGDALFAKLAPIRRIFENMVTHHRCISPLQLIKPSSSTQLCLKTLLTTFEIIPIPTPSMLRPVKFLGTFFALSVQLPPQLHEPALTRSQKFRDVLEMALTNNTVLSRHTIAAGDW